MEWVKGLVKPEIRQGGEESGWVELEEGHVI